MPATHLYQYGYAHPVLNTDPSGRVVQLPPMDGGCPAGSFWDAAQAGCVSPASSPERRYDDPFKAMLGDYEPCGPPNIMVVTQVYDDPAHPGSVSYKTECLPAGFVPEQPSGKTIIQGWTIDPNTGIAKLFCAVEDDEDSDDGASASSHSISEPPFKNKFPRDSVHEPIQIFKPDQARSSTFNKVVNYVVKEDGTLVLGRKDNFNPGGGHIDLAQGKPVLAAGEAKIVGGKLRYVDNSSGHYLPNGESARLAAETAFKKAGFDPVPYVEKYWNGSAWVPK